jgi:AcrR family transcriptional regulator
VSRSQRARLHILDRGLELVSVEGLLGTSIGRLAKHVGMSKSGLYAHFESKEALQVELLERAHELLSSVVIAPALEQPRGEARVCALFENWLWWASGEVLPGGCVLFVAAAECDDQPSVLRERLVLAQRDWIESLANAARGTVRDGHFRADLDCERFAFDLYGVLLAYHVYLRLLGEERAARWSRASFASLRHAARLPH